MITDHEWSIIAQKAFPYKTVQAPPFLWTRILARIHTEETRRASSWWLQWRWMSRVTATMALLVTLGAFYLLQRAATPLEAALEGRSNQEQALQLASADTLTPGDSVELFVGTGS